MKTWAMLFLLLSVGCNSYSPQSQNEKLSPEDQQRFLAELIDQAQGTPPPTFSSIVKDIFNPKCVICHRPGGSAAKLPVTDYKILIDRMWIVPNDLTQSSLYDSVINGRMPPGRPLGAKELEAIEIWIKNGAPNN